MATTKKAAAPKKAAAKTTKTAAPKKAAAKQEAPKKAGAPKKPDGKIAQIIALHLKGKTIAQIVEAGFNKTTASIQIAKYKRENGGGK